MHIIYSFYYHNEPNPEVTVEYFLFNESNLRILGGFFNGKTICVFPNISLIYSFGLCFNFWLIALTMFRI